MRNKKRLVAATLGAGLTLACAQSNPDVPVAQNVKELVQKSRDSNAALMRGDIDQYTSLISLAPDFTLFSPLGGEPTRGSLTSDALQRMGRFFKNGTHEQELVHAYGSPDMVVLAIIERSRVEVGGLPSQEWALRVTLVYRREGKEWRLAHRHADPLVDDVPLRYAARLARGERS